MSPRIASKARHCPCGCGYLLQSYGGAPRIVCSTFWKALEPELRRLFLHSPLSKRRPIARTILTQARALAATRRAHTPFTKPKTTKPTSHVRH